MVLLFDISVLCYAKLYVVTAPTWQDAYNLARNPDTGSPGEICVPDPRGPLRWTIFNSITTHRWDAQHARQESVSDQGRSRVESTRPLMSPRRVRSGVEIGGRQSPRTAPTWRRPPLLGHKAMNNDANGDLMPSRDDLVSYIRRAVNGSDPQVDADGLRGQPGLVTIVIPDEDLLGSPFQMLARTNLTHPTTGCIDHHEILLLTDGGQLDGSDRGACAALVSSPYSLSILLGCYGYPGLHSGEMEISAIAAGMDYILAESISGTGVTLILDYFNVISVDPDKVMFKLHGLEFPAGWLATHQAFVDMHTLGFQISILHTKSHKWLQPDRLWAYALNEIADWVVHAGLLELAWQPSIVTTLPRMRLHQDPVTIIDAARHSCRVIDPLEVRVAIESRRDIGSVDGDTTLRFFKRFTDDTLDLMATVMNRWFWSGTFPDSNDVQGIDIPKPGRSSQEMRDQRPLSTQRRHQQRP